MGAHVKTPFAEIRLIPGTASDLALRDAFVRRQVGPFHARTTDSMWYAPSVRVTARVVKSTEVVYWIREA